jgi:hypothetical protein
LSSPSFICILLASFMSEKKLFVDLEEQILVEFSFGPQELGGTERTGVRVGRRPPSLDKDVDIEDPVALAAEAARLYKLYAGFNRLQRDLELQKSERINRPRKRKERTTNKCRHCRRRLSKHLLYRDFCDWYCYDEARGRRRPRCRICRSKIELPKHGRIKLYCSIRCRNNAGNLKRATAPRVVKSCRWSQCKKPIEQPRTGKFREFCDHKCRQKYYYWNSREQKAATDLQLQ